MQTSSARSVKSSIRSRSAACMTGSSSERWIRTDWMAAPQYEPVQGTTYALFVTGDDLGETKAVFEKLRAGADADRFQPLHAMPFGMYGQFYDRFGVQWIFVVPNRSSE